MPRLLNRLPGQALRIGVSGFAVSLLKVSRWFGPKAELLAEQPFSPEGVSALHAHHAIGLALRELLAGQDVQGWPASFVLADDLARMWQVTPPAQAARMADLEAAAALRFHSLYGEPASGWHITADWDTRQPFFAAAMPQPLLATLEQCAADHGMAVVEVQPHFVTAWNRWQGALKADAWFGQVHDNLLTLAIIGGGRLHAIRALPLPRGADQYWLAQTLKREALLAGLDAPQLVQLCGQVPAPLAKPAATAGQISCSVLGAALPGEEKWSLASVLARGGLAA
ncbi:hypothetical protein [Massilia sp. Root418]|uniref:hypothetical protein n=1 Tax=Massilia sp. Root418 TaxID=1736532 RepID=UPI000A91212F|nr:hypothetical protein [Massilia sp. Root418]